MLYIEAAEKFICETARPFEKAVYDVLYHHHSVDCAIEELQKFQNEDGGFGHALEADNWNPNSNPIATNDAIIWLYRMNAIESAKDIVEGIVRYLQTHDSFDENEKKWLFAIDSNKDYPHAIWWEKNDNGIDGFNPTVSLSAFMVCYGKREALYEEILCDALSYLRTTDKLGGDSLKCYLLAYELLKKNCITDIINLDVFKKLLSDWIGKVICPDTEKYGVEYVTAPSDIFGGLYSEFVSEEIRPLIKAELDVIGKLQKEDGGFDVSWQWYTSYAEFEQARIWWRPRVTLEKLLFVREMKYDC
ncbi:MAG: hypothetical protein IKL04_06335 [Lachnospiraceae bacterium]|nr:hypothetical protein [Lachnospiraceae bacterium]